MSKKLFKATDGFSEIMERNKGVHLKQVVSFVLDVLDHLQSLITK